MNPLILVPLMMVAAFFASVMVGTLWGNAAQIAILPLLVVAAFAIAYSSQRVAVRSRGAGSRETE